MRAGSASIIATGLIAFASSCSDSSSGGPATAGFDCSFLAGDNCWKQAVAVVAACAPPPGSTGKLSADGASCTFSNGAVVQFSTPVDLASASDPTKGPSPWGLIVTVNGAPCFQFFSQASGLQLVTSLGRFKEDIASGANVTLSCGGGVQYGGSEASFLACANEGGALPGSFYSTSANSVTFGFSGGGGSIEHLTVLTCHT
jgi:hypothetical protein